MPPCCQFGTEISGKGRRGPNLSLEQRLTIIAKAGSGVSVAELVAEFGWSPNCILTTIQIGKTHSTTLEAPRSGRPPILSLHQKKIIYQRARAAPKIEYSELAKVGVFVTAEGTPSKPPSRSTLYQCLKRQGLSNFCCKKRPKLNRMHVLKRLQFCRQYWHFE
jgi:transposase